MVFGKQKYKISLEIEPKSSMYTSIIRYLATFPDITNFFQIPTQIKILINICL